MDLPNNCHIVKIENHKIIQGVMEKLEPDTGFVMTTEQLEKFQSQLVAFIRDKLDYMYELSLCESSPEEKDTLH